MNVYSIVLYYFTEVVEVLRTLFVINCVCNIMSAVRMPRMY